MKNISVLIFYAIVFANCCAVSETIGQEWLEVNWVRQFGTADDDRSFSIAVDCQGATFVGGWTKGDLGDTNAGNWDGFVAKYDSIGNMLWTKQLGTSSEDWVDAIALDGNGNLFVSGRTYGSLGGVNAGQLDAFLAKYDTMGNILWTKQLGTDVADGAWSVTVDPNGNAYISGTTRGNLGGINAGVPGSWNDAFLAKYDTMGNLLWTEQLGTARDEVALNITADSFGNVYVSGITGGNLGGTNMSDVYHDVFLAKYDTLGNLLWTEQLGTEYQERPWSMAVDSSSNVYVCGFTNGTLDLDTKYRNNTFLAKFNSSGDLLWVDQLDAQGVDIFYSVEVDSFGNAFLSSRIDGHCGRNCDTFLAKYNPSGDLLWMEQIGTRGNARPYSIALGDANTVFLGGTMDGNLSSYANDNDVFLLKLTIPEPGSILLLGTGGLMLIRRR